MSEIDILFAGVPVLDFDAAVTWYEQVLGRPADVAVAEGEVMWRFAEAAWLYVVRNGERAGKALVTLSVGDLEEAVAAIAARGVGPAPIETVGDAGRKATFSDPDGNLLSFIEVADSA